MFGFRRKSYRKIPFKRNYKSYAKKKGPSPIKRIIRSEIARSVENKTQQYFNTGRSLTTSYDAPGNFDTNNVFPVGLDITNLIVSQGVGQGQRVGNTIKTRKLMFKGTVFPLGYDAITNTQPVPQQIKMWIFYDKILPTQNPTPRGNGDFFQNGSGTATFSNTLMDMWRPHNKDRYVVLATRVFKVGYEDFEGAGGVQAQGWMSNNDFKMNQNFSIDLTKHYPKIVKFNDNQFLPTTRGLWCMIQPVWANGGLNTNAYSCRMQYMLDYTYEDA